MLVEKYLSKKLLLMTIIQNNKILIPDTSLIKSYLDFIWINPNKKVEWEIEQVRNRVDEKLKDPWLTEVETFSVDWFADNFVNNPNIQKDLDDWFKAERTGYWYLLKVNISSPSSVIDINSEILKNILLQTTSIYYESHVNPMMPFSLSNDLFSLIYDKERLGLTVEIELDKEGNVLDFKIYQSKIKNILMANHNEFDRIFRNKAWKELNIFNDDIKVLNEIWDILAKNRIHNNWFSSSIDSQRKIGYDKLDKYEIPYVSSVVEEIMILTNNLVAKFLIKNPEITGTFRNHMPEFKWKKFEWWEMGRATYDTKMKYHYWLLMDEYTHFTSPIRRALDLFLHYWINAFLEWKEQVFDKNNLEEYLQKYLNPRQEFIVNWTNQYNREVTKKQSERLEKNKVRNHIKQNPVNENNISEVSDFDLEINLYNFFKNKENIPEYYFHELEKRFKSKNYINNNKWTLFILAFSKNEKLIQIFNKYFVSYSMQKSFINYFNDSDFILDYFNISFVKNRDKILKDFYEDRKPLKRFIKEKEWIELKWVIKKDKKVKRKKSDTKIKYSNKYYLNKKNDNLFFNWNWLTKSEAFKSLLNFIINSEENFLK